jgi:hypothetical protein
LLFDISTPTHSYTQDSTNFIVSINSLK